MRGQEAVEGTGGADGEGEVRVERGEELAEIVDEQRGAGYARAAGGGSLSHKGSGGEDQRRENEREPAGENREEPEDGGEKQAEEAEHEPDGARQRPETETDTRDFFERVAGSGEEHQDAEGEQERIRTGGLDAARHSAEDEQGDEEEEVVGLERGEAGEIAANCLDQGSGYSAEHSASRVRRAVLRQGNCAARRGPAADGRERNGSSETRRSMAAAMARGSAGSNWSAASAARLASGSTEEHAVGTPAARASKTGSPKPSNLLG